MSDHSQTMESHASLLSLLGSSRRCENGPGGLVSWKMIAGFQRIPSRREDSASSGGSTPRGVRYWSTPHAWTLLFVIALEAGCASRNPHGPDAPTQVDRIIQAYPSADIQRGRLLIIADFEDPRQMQLFSFEGVSDEGRMTLDPRKGLPETGTGCLLLTVGSAGDCAVIANTEQSEWYLKRDWRPYDLLTLTVHAPQDGLSLDLGVGSGPKEQRLFAYSSMPLSRGWNLVRLDLTEAAEQVPLDDIREVRLSFSGATRPVQIRVDDILLAGNRIDLLGDSTNKTGDLYVQQAGRHWNVGAGGRFEVSFANGQITSLHNLASDPYRLRNVVRGTTLGPVPVVVDERATQLGDFSAWGGSVVARQEIIEMSAVRVVVASEWRFVDQLDDALDRRPFQRWTYTVYPTGQMFVAVEATAETESWPPSQFGIAVSFANPPDDPLETHIEIGTVADSAFEESQAPMEAKQPIFAEARIHASDSLLVFIPYSVDSDQRIVEINDEARRRISFVLLGGTPDSDVWKWTCQLYLGAASSTPRGEVFLRALDYATPGSLRIEVGQSPKATARALRVDGFDPAQGVFVIATERNRARIALDGRDRSLFAPAFEISGGQGAQSWVYVDNLIFGPVSRSDESDLVFQLPDVIQKPVLVEALFRRDDGSSP